MATYRTLNDTVALIPTGDDKRVRRGRHRDAGLPRVRVHDGAEAEGAPRKGTPTLGGDVQVICTKYRLKKPEASFLNRDCLVLRLFWQNKRSEITKQFEPKLIYISFLNI